MSTQTTTTSKPAIDPNRLVLKGVRASYFHGFVAKAVQEGQDPKFSVTSLMDKQENAEQIKLVQATIDRIIKDTWKGKKPVGLKVCLRDGVEKDGADGYGDHVMFLSASAGQDRPPQIVDCDKTRRLTAADNRPYSGCYVNVVVRLWAQDNKYGKRINAALEIVQFVKHGEPFGATAPKAADILDDEAAPAEDEVSFDD